jgi:hypothetical protein
LQLFKNGSEACQGKIQGSFSTLFAVWKFSCLNLSIHIHSSPMTRNGSCYFGKNENDRFSFFSGKEGVSQAEWNSFRMGEIGM